MNQNIKFEISVDRKGQIFKYFVDKNLNFDVENTDNLSLTQLLNLFQSDKIKTGDVITIKVNETINQQIHRHCEEYISNNIFAD